MKIVVWDSLKPTAQSLLKAARKCRENAYAPYSNYLVGAAVLSENGKIFSGCNVETATFSQTTHAERAAIVAMVVDGEIEIKALACVGIDSGPPCAECRQVIWEFCNGNPDVSIISADADFKDIRIYTVAELYPFPFGPKDLGQ